MEASNIFLKNEETILKGEFTHGLLDKCKYEAQIKDIISLSVEKIYQSKEVIDKEITGYEVIKKLLDIFIKAVNNSYENRPTSYDQLILRILPQTIDFSNKSLYLRLLNVCHYVASLSDSRAILIYKKIAGIEI
jgi:dGTPase